MGCCCDKGRCLFGRLCNHFWVTITMSCAAASKNVATDLGSSRCLYVLKPFCKICLWDTRTLKIRRNTNTMNCGSVAIGDLCFLVYCHRGVFVSKLLWETFGKTVELATSTTSFWECSDRRTGDSSVTTAHLCSGHIWKDTRTRRDTDTTSLWECSDRRSRQDTLEEVSTLHMTLKRATSTTSLCR